MVAQRVKRLSAMQETRVRSLGWEDPLEKEMATHSSTLACKIPWMEKPGRLQSMGSQRVRHGWVISLFKLSISFPRFTHVRGYTNKYFFLVPNNISLYYILFFYSIDKHLGSSAFWLLIILLFIWVYNFFCKYMFYFSYIYI